MTTSGMTRTLIFAYMGTFSLITPVGIAIGIGLVQSASNNSASNGPAAVLNGLAAGTLIYVVFFEILEKERQKKVRRWRRRTQILAKMYRVMVLNVPFYARKNY